MFGEDDWDDVPISTAVQASTALPMVYKPVEVKGRELVDGGIRPPPTSTSRSSAGRSSSWSSTRSCPYVNDFQKVSRRARQPRPPRSDMGFPQIGYQTFKLLAHQRLHESVSHWSEKYPGVDIVLIEPEPNDELMFATNIMNFTKRVDIARHGFESVTIKLAKDYDNFRAICARHGIEISATRVRRVIKRFAQERERLAPGGGSWSRRRARCCARRRTKVAGRRSQVAGGNCYRPLQTASEASRSEPSAADPLVRRF